MRLSFSRNLNYYYHEFHGIRNSFHNRNHILIHVQMFGTISHSLQGMIQIQLNKTGDLSLSVNYFTHQQEDMISIQSIF